LFDINIQPLIVHHGYAAVFAVVMLESMGVPLPGETALLLASAYAGATGHISIAYVILAAVAGAVIGDNIGYWVGRSVGARALSRYGHFVGLTSNRLRLGEYLFERHGGKIVFFGRFIAILRVFAALLAGLNKYNWRSFLIFNAAGAVTWAIVMGVGGYFFGDAMTRVSGPLGMIGFGILVLGILVFWLVLRQQEKKWEDKATSDALREEEQKDEARAQKTFYRGRQPPDAA
jgi:membrane protein DedA with SNARE-associated domain